MDNRKYFEYLGTIYGLDNDLESYSDYPELCKLYIDNNLINLEENIKYLQKICKIHNIKISNTLIGCLVGIIINENPIFIKTLYNLLSMDCDQSVEYKNTQKMLIRLLRDISKNKFMTTLSSVNAGITFLGSKYVNNRIGHYYNKIMKSIEYSFEMIGITKSGEVYRFNRNLEKLNRNHWITLQNEITFISIEKIEEKIEFNCIKNKININEFEVLFKTNTTNFW